jgi:hypothetical protein
MTVKTECQSTQAQVKVAMQRLQNQNRGQIIHDAKPYPYRGAYPSKKKKII